MQPAADSVIDKKTTWASAQVNAIPDNQKIWYYLFLGIGFSVGIALIVVACVEKLTIPGYLACIIIGVFLASFTIYLLFFIAFKKDELGIKTRYKKSRLYSLNQNLKSKIRKGFSTKKKEAKFPVFQTKASYDHLQPYYISKNSSPFPTISTFSSHGTHAQYNANDYMSTNSNYEPFTHYQKYGYYHPTALQISQYSNA